jgi:hypothetical protein
MSHGMLHHIEPKYPLNCCIYLIWFEFETWFEFELKTLEKINRKAIRKSLENRKPNSAQVGQLSPTPRARACAHAPPVPDRRAPPIGANQRALSSPLSLLSGADLSAPSSRMRARFSLCSTVPTCQPSSTSRPRSPRRGCAHDRAFFGHVRAPTPLLSSRPARPPLLSHLRPLPISLALSLTLLTRTGSSATARWWPLPVPWPPSRLCPVQCHGELHLTVSCSGHPSVHPLPLCFIRSVLTRATFAQPELRHSRPVEPLCLRRCFTTPALLLEVSNLPAPLIWSLLHWLARDCSPEQSSAAVSPLRRGLGSLVPLRRYEGHG